MPSSVRRKYPYVEIHKNVINSTKFESAVDKMLYICLTSFEGQELPDNETLADMVRVTPLAIPASFRRLREGGFIVKDENDSWVLMFY